MKILNRVLFLLLLIGMARTNAVGRMGMMNFGSDNFSQDTLFNPTNTTLGFYAGPAFEGTWIRDQMVFAGGFEMAAVINHSFYIGFTGKGTMVPGFISAGIGWGELMLGYSFMPALIVHPLAKIMAGAGSVMEMDYNNRTAMHMSGMASYAPFFVTEMELGAEINILKWVRFTPYAGYRYILGNINLDGLNDSSLRNFNFGINLDFGIF